MEGASGYINGALPPHLRFLLKDLFSLMLGSAIEMPQAAGLGPLAATSLQTRSFPVAIRR